MFRRLEEISETCEIFEESTSPNSYNNMDQEPQSSIESDDTTGSHSQVNFPNASPNPVCSSSIDDLISHGESKSPEGQGESKSSLPSTPRSSIPDSPSKSRSPTPGLWFPSDSSICSSSSSNSNSGSKDGSRNRSISKSKDQAVSQPRLKITKNSSTKRPNIVQVQEKRGLNKQINIFEDSDEEKSKKDLIAAIFGDSDEEEEFEGYTENIQKKSGKKSKIFSDTEDEEETDEGEPERKKQKLALILSDNSEDEEKDSHEETFENNFDMMTQKNKRETNEQLQRVKPKIALIQSDDSEDEEKDSHDETFDYDSDLMIKKNEGETDEQQQEREKQKQSQTESFYTENKDEESDYETFGYDFDQMLQKREDETDEQQHERERQKLVQIESDDPDDRKNDTLNENLVYDFDLMMLKKKEERIRRKKKADDYAIINDNDELIMILFNRMRKAAKEDRKLYKKDIFSTKKLNMLPLAHSQLQKSNLAMAFIEHGVLEVIALWLKPLPDGNLPDLEIREKMLRLLRDFPFPGQHYLKKSTIGKVLVCLYKHPEETRKNKKVAHQIITEWKKVILNISTDEYSSLSHEEMFDRDVQHLPEKRRRELREKQRLINEQPEKTGDDGNKKNKLFDNPPKKSKKSQSKSEEKVWIGRAIPPTPSTNDYIIRPKSDIEFADKKSKKVSSRFDKFLKRVHDKKNRNRRQMSTFSTFSVDGRKMI